MQNVTLRNIAVHPSLGLSRTITEMNYLEKLSLGRPDFIKFVYQNFYSECTACIPGKIWKYIKENFDYVEDEKDETITAPYIILETKQGDCDCFSLFAKTCLDILGGWYTNYLLLGRNINGFTHIVCFAHRGRFLLNYNDPVIIDGANDQFNVVSNVYKYRKLV